MLAWLAPGARKSQLASGNLLLERSRPSISINMRVVPLLVMLTARVTALTARQGTPRLSKTIARAAPVSSSTSSNLLQRLQGVAEDAIKVAQETGPRAALARTVQGQRAVLETLLELRAE